MEIGFNQSNIVAVEGQLEPVNVCIQVTSESLERNVSVSLETLGGGSRGTYMYVTGQSN